MKLNCPTCNGDLIKNSGFGIKEINDEMYVIFIAECNCRQGLFYVKMKIDTENIKLYD